MIDRRKHTTNTQVDGSSQQILSEMVCFSDELVPVAVYSMQESFKKRTGRSSYTETRKSEKFHSLDCLRKNTGSSTKSAGTILTLVKPNQNTSYRSLISDKKYPLCKGSSENN